MFNIAAIGAGQIQHEHYLLAHACSVYLLELLSPESCFYIYLHQASVPFPWRPEAIIVQAKIDVEAVNLLPQRFDPRVLHEVAPNFIIIC